MAELLDPMPYARIYDPTCGSGGLLVKARRTYDEHNPEQRGKAPQL